MTERTATIARIRHLARQVAELWLEERQALGFPLLQGAARQAWLEAHPPEEAASPEAAGSPEVAALAG